MQSPRTFKQRKQNLDGVINIRFVKFSIIIISALAKVC